MTRPVSRAYRSALQAQETAAEIVTLARIGHDDLDPFLWPDGICVAGHPEAITVRGVVYHPGAFSIPWPDQMPGEVPKLRATIAADRRIRDALRQIHSPATVTLSEVLRDSPDVIEQGPITLTLTRVRMTEATVTGDLELFSGLDARFPARTMTPQTRPGLF